MKSYIVKAANQILVFDSYFIKIRINYSTAEYDLYT
jgi:hypothetical protein